MALILFLFNTCKKPESAVDVDLYMDLSFVDQNGNDLLRPSTQNAYNVSLFRLEYYNQGKLETFYKSNYDAAYGVGPKVFSRPSSGLLTVRIYPPADTTFLKLSNGDLDTIIDPRTRGRASVRITKVWYNGKLVWDEKDKTDRYIIIKKQMH